MPGPRSKYPVQLTTEEEQALRKLVSARNSPQVKVLRARILLTAHDHPEWRPHQVARAVGCVVRTVHRWQKRWHETHSIDDLPRPGAPRRFSP
jgi:hypothetical protein